MNKVLMIICTLTLGYIVTSCGGNNSNQTGSDSETTTESDRVLESSSDTESAPDSSSDSDVDIDTEDDSETLDEIDGGPDVETDNSPVTCDEHSAESRCGSAERCVDGYCCDTPCDGMCDACHLPGFEGICTILDDSVVCRPAQGECDIAESCDGMRDTCAPDVKSTDECRASAGLCDLAESCDGLSNFCPTDAKSTAVCRKAADTCDLAESCDGGSNECPLDDYLIAEGEECEDDSDCCSEHCSQNECQSPLHCTGQSDFALCSVDTSSFPMGDLGYDICFSEVCISPGTCDNYTCNAPGTNFECTPINLTADNYIKTFSNPDHPVVEDQTTDLIWQGCIAGVSGSVCQLGTADSFTWQEALSYCDSLNWGGRTDWYLPNIWELQSTVDYGERLPAIDEETFPATNYNEDYWSATTFRPNKKWAWVVNFGIGLVKIYKKDKTEERHVRCVSVDQ